MAFDRLTRLAQKRAFARIAHPYIIQTYRTRVQELFNILMDYELGSKLKRAYLLRILAPQFISFGNLVPQFFPRFGLIRGIFDRDTIFWLAEQTEVIKIFSDEPMWIAQYPVVPPEGTFSVTYARKLKNFTTTYYTKKLIGADRANFKGFFGDGIKVAIVDSVAEWSPVIVKRPEKGEKLENAQVEIIPISEVVDFEKENVIITPQGEEIVEPKEDIYIFMGHMHKSNKHWARVKRIIRHKYKGKMIRVITHTGLVDVTPNHSLIKAGGNPKVISAKEVKIGDRLAMAINDLRRKKTGCEKGSFIGTKELAWLFGLFVAEGSASRNLNSRGYYVSISTQDYRLATIVSHLMEKFFNKKPIISSYKDVYKVCIQSYGLYKYFRKHFYTKHGDKKVPKFILNAPNPIIEVFLEGYLEGDGWKSTGGNHTTWKKWAGFTTKSQTLAMGLIWLFHRVYGLKHTTYASYDINHTKAFDIRFVNEHKKDPREIKKIIEFDYDGYVYDIEVEEDPHTFCTGVGPIKVHNTGCARYHESINRAIFDTVMSSQRVDDNGHGSWCTACVGGIRTRDDMLSSMLHRDIWTEGMAPRCDLISIKALGYVIGTGLTSQIIEAIDRAVSYYHADVISMSLGGPVQANKPEDDPYYVVFDDLIKSNVIPVVAAGNEGPEPGTVSSPGALPQVLTVGAYDPISGEIAKFSSRGPTPWNDVKPDCVAPGVNIHAPCVNLLDFTGDNLPQRYSILSGTSMATPHISGLVALMRQAHHAIVGKTLTVEEIKKILQAFGHEKTNDDGWGMLTWEMYEMWIETEYNIEI